MIVRHRETHDIFSKDPTVCPSPLGHLSGGHRQFNHHGGMVVSVLQRPSGRSSACRIWIPAAIHAVQRCVFDGISVHASGICLQHGLPYHRVLRLCKGRTAGRFTFFTQVESHIFLHRTSPGDRCRLNRASQSRHHLCLCSAIHWRHIPSIPQLSACRREQRYAIRL